MANGSMTLYFSSYLPHKGTVDIDPVLPKFKELYSYLCSEFAIRVSENVKNSPERINNI